MWMQGVERLVIACWRTSRRSSWNRCRDASQTSALVLGRRTTSFSVTISFPFLDVTERIPINSYLLLHGCSDLIEDAGIWNSKFPPRSAEQRRLHQNSRAESMPTLPGGLLGTAAKSSVIASLSRRSNTPSRDPICTRSPDAPLVALFVFAAAGSEIRA